MDKLLYAAEYWQGQQDLFCQDHQGGIRRSLRL
jgi:hypothetical protein